MALRGSRTPAEVWPCRRRFADGVAVGVRVLLTDLNGPHGLALRDGWLYIAESDAGDRVPDPDLAAGRADDIALTTAERRDLAVYLLATHP